MMARFVCLYFVHYGKKYWNNPLCSRACCQFSHVNKGLANPCVGREGDAFMIISFIKGERERQRECTFFFHYPVESFSFQLLSKMATIGVASPYLVQLVLLSSRACMCV